MKFVKSIKGLFPDIRIGITDIAQCQTCRTEVDMIFELDTGTFDAGPILAVEDECTEGLT